MLTYVVFYANVTSNQVKPLKTKNMKTLKLFIAFAIFFTGNCFTVRAQSDTTLFDKVVDIMRNDMQLHNCWDLYVDKTVISINDLNQMILQINDSVIGGPSAGTHMKFDTVSFISLRLYDDYRGKDERCSIVIGGTGFYQGYNQSLRLSIDVYRDKKQEYFFGLGNDDQTLFISGGRIANKYEDFVIKGEIHVEPGEHLDRRMLLYGTVRRSVWESVSKKIIDPLVAKILVRE